MSRFDREDPTADDDDSGSGLSSFERIVLYGSLAVSAISVVALFFVPPNWFLAPILVIVVATMLRRIIVRPR